MYIIWALFPDSWLNSVGITYLPARLVDLNCIYLVASSSNSLLVLRKEEHFVSNNNNNLQIFFRGIQHRDTIISC